MAYSGTLLKLNGNTVQGIKTNEILPEKLYSSVAGSETGRDLNGNLHLNFVGVCPKLQLVLRPGLSESQASTLLKILSKPSFTATYYDYILKRDVSAEYYANTATLGLIDKSRGFFDEISFNIIPLRVNGGYA